MADESNEMPQTRVIPLPTEEAVVPAVTSPSSGSAQVYLYLQKKVQVMHSFF